MVDTPPLTTPGAVALVATPAEPENMELLAARLEVPDWDPVPRETLFNNREDLLREIETAKEFFTELLR